MEQMPDYNYLIAQAKQVFPGAKVVVSYPEEEIIHILVDERLFCFEIGSDDEAYNFSDGKENFQIPLMDWE